MQQLIEDLHETSIQMKKITLHVCTLIAFVAVLMSCNKSHTFQVNGTLANADGQTLYLEHRGLGGISLLDSAVLKENGAFSFKQEAPQNPEFYQLRVGNNVAVFAIDSTETISVKADASNLYQSFAVENSAINDQIKQVDKLTQEATATLTTLEEQHKKSLLDDMGYVQAIDSALTAYKTTISNLIISNPASPAAYYAVFQKIGDYLIFDPYDRKDYAMFGAVATSWQKYFPETPRTKHLVDFTMGALKTRKQQEQQVEMLENAPVVDNVGMPEINLTDIQGNSVSLSSLKGKAIVLDFTVYQADYSPSHNRLLNDLYQQYKAQGLEVYQISFDSDEHLWKNAAVNLPWITVRDKASINSSLLALYNVRGLPTAFVINKSGDVVARVENYTTLKGEIEKVL